MGASGRAVVCLIALCATGAPASAGAEPVPPPGWSSSELDPGERIVDLDLAVTGPDARVAVYNVSRSPSGPAIKARIDRLGAAPSIQSLDGSSSFYPAVDGTQLGGVVAAWYRQDEAEVRIAEMRPGDSELGSAQAAAGVGGNFSYGRPHVRVNERGDAIVVHLQGGEGDERHVVARFRPTGGSFGAPERIVGSSRRDGVYPRDVALGPDGTAVVVAAREGRTVAVTRPASGSFGAPEAIGGELPEHSWQSPRVGVDALGNVVAAWLEGAPINRTGPVKLSFRPAGGSFGPPIDTTLRATDHGRIDLGVSLAGELLLVVEASTDNPYGGTHIEGIHAVAGNAATGTIAPPRALTGIWGSYPSFSMNALGHAIVAWDECCPMALRARRRAPLGPFGPVEDVQPPIRFEGVRHGRWVLDAHIDVLGNVLTGWIDSEQPSTTWLGWDGPRAGVEVPELEHPVEVPDDPIDVLPDEPIPAEHSADVAAQPGFHIPPPTPPAPPLEPRGPRPSTDVQPLRIALKLRRGFGGGARATVSALVRCTERCQVRVGGRAGRALLRPVEVTLRPGRGRLLRLPLTQARAAHTSRRSRARGRQTVRLRAVAVDAGGNVARAAASRRLAHSARRR